MRTTIAFSLFLTFTLLGTSCKKRKGEFVLTSPTRVTLYEDYARLKVGNYWVYGRFQVEKNGTVTYLNQNDSCYIDKDTLVRGQVYFKLHKHDFVFDRDEVLFLKDSMHYLVSLNSGILFSSQDFSTVFKTTYVTSPQDPNVDTLYKVTTKMTDKDLEITVPAGTFKTCNMQSTYLVSPKVATPGVDNPRYQNMRYAKNVGLALETEYFFSAVTWHREKRLVRYRVR